MAEGRGHGIVPVSACPHPFRAARVDHALPAGLSVAEILVQVQPDPVLLQHAHVFIGPDYVPRDRWGQVRPKAGALVAIRVVPSGGDGKNPLATILTIAVIAAAVWVGQLEFVAGLGTFGQAAVVAATGLVGSLLVNAIAPPPTPKFDRLSAERDSPTYSIAGGSNELRPWGPVPLVLGGHRVFPPYAAQPFTEIDGDDQFWRVLFLIGYGPVELEDFKIGETPIGDFPDVESEVREGFAGEPPRALFTSDVFEEGLSIALTQVASWQQRTTAQEVDEISVDVTFPSGLAFIAADGTRQDRTVVIEVEYSPAGAGTWSVPGGGRAFAARTAGPMGAPSFKKDDDGDETRYRKDRVVMDRMSGDVIVLKGRRRSSQASAVPPPVPPTAIPIAQVLRKSGETTISAARITDERPVAAPFALATDFTPAPTAPESASIDIAAGTLIFGGIQTTARQTTTVRRGLRFAVPTRGLYDVRLRRTTPDSSSGQVVDLVFWTALRAIKHVDPVQLTGVATVALRIRATGSLFGVIQQFNCIATSVVPDWTGSVWVEQATSKPASLYRHLFQGPHMTRPRTDAQMDLPGLQAWADANRQEGRAFNAYIDFRTTLRELAGDIAAAGRASRGMIDGKWTVVRDRKQTVPVQMFTPRNSWGFRASKAFVDPPHGLNVRFMNEQIGFKRDERVVFADGFDEVTATRLEALDLFGITNPDLSWQDGRYHQAAAKLRPETFELNVDFEHLVATRGDMVAVAHDAMLVGLAQGRIKAVQVDGGGAATGVTLDELVTMELGKTYALTVRPGAGDPVTRAVNTVPGETDTVVFATTIPAGTIAAGDLAAFGETDRVTAEMVIREVRPGPDESAKLILVDAAPAVHDAGVFPVAFVPADVDIGADRIAIADNPFFDGDILRFTTTGTLPGNVALATDHFVVGRTVGDFQVSLTKGGAPIDLTGGGAGTHTATRQIPPFDSKVTVPAGVASPGIESIASDGAVLFRDVDGSLSSRIFVRLLRVSGGRFDLADVEGRYRIDGTDVPFIVLPRVPAELREYSFRPVEDGETYEFQLRYVTAEGRPGEWGASTIHLVEGKTAPPNDVTGFNAQQNGNAVTFQWDQVPDLDLDGYEIRFGPIGITWEDAEPLTEAASGTRITDAAVPPGNWDFHIRAVDTTRKDGMRNYSAASAVVALTVVNALDILRQVAQKPIGWPGTLTGFVYNPATGNLNPDSTVLASADAAQDVFDNYVWQPVAQAIYEAPEIDIDFDDRARAWGDIQSNLGPGETGLAAPKLEIDYRIDAGAYDGFEPWTIGEVEGRFFKFRLVLDTAKGLARVTGFQPTVDQLEEVIVQTVAVSAGGTAIVFPKPFHIVPQIEVSAEAGAAGAARFATWEAVTTTGFTVRVFDQAGTGVAGNVTYHATGV